MITNTVSGQYDEEKFIYDCIDLKLLSYYFALPAVVIAVNANNQTVDVKPTIMKKYNGQNIERAKICNVPFQFPRGGDAYITLPIKVDDEGLLIFAQRDISNWKQLGGIQPLKSNRLLNYNDCVFIPGISSQPRKVTYDSNNISIVKDSGVITITNNEINAPDYTIKCKNIEASGTITAIGIIKSLADVIANTISLLTHKHSGVTSGGSNTGEPL